jgi:hypothetical protein
MRLFIVIDICNIDRMNVIKKKKKKNPDLSLKNIYDKTPVSFIDNEGIICLFNEYIGSKSKDPLNQTQHSALMKVKQNELKSRSHKLIRIFTHRKRVINSIEDISSVIH